MKTFLKAITIHYADFNGRMSRRDFWTFLLWFFLITAAAGIFFPPKDSPLHIFWLCFFITPFIAAQVRRLHDAAIPGWAALLLFFPPLNLALLVFFCLPPTDTNRYGRKPGTGTELSENTRNNDVITLTKER